MSITTTDTAIPAEMDLKVLDTFATKSAERNISPEEYCEKIMEQAFYTTDKTVVMIDGRALYETSSSLSFDIQFSNLTRLFKNHSIVNQFHYYNEVPTSVGHHPQVPLMKWLSLNGYIVNSEFATEKNNVSVLVRMATDMMTLAANKNVNHFVIFANNHALAYPIRQLVHQGMRVTVVGVEQNNNENYVTIATQLRQDASQFIDIRDLICEISR